MEQLWMREAGNADISVLTVMNAALIRDEGSDNPMDTAALAVRMVRFLNEEGYKAVLFGIDASPAGYALYRCTPHPYEADKQEAYIRQFYVDPRYRRNGIGRAAVHRLIDGFPKTVVRVEMDVLDANARGVAFWQSVGFAPHVIRMRFKPGLRGSRT